MLLTRRMRSGAEAVLTGSTADIRVNSGKRPLPANGERSFALRLLLVAGFRALRPAGIGAGIVLGGSFDQRLDLRLDRLDPVGALGPLLPIPLRHVSGVVAVVVGARDLDRRDEAGRAHLLQPRLADLQRFETAAHVGAVDHLLAGDLLRVADRFCDDHRVVYTEDIEV